MDRLVAFLIRADFAGFTGVEMRLACTSAHQFAGAGFPEGLCYSLISLLLHIDCGLRISDYGLNTQSVIRNCLILTLWSYDY